MYDNAIALPALLTLSWTTTGLAASITRNTVAAARDTFESTAFDHKHVADLATDLTSAMAARLKRSGLTRLGV